MTQGYHEPKNPFTGKATDHQRNAKKSKAKHISNAEIVPLKSSNKRFVITPKWMNIFNKEIRWREKIHGAPLPTIQKIKAAREVSHQIFPANKGYRGPRGHELREIFRKEILKTVDVDYKKQRN